jgi:hypothetical protein
MGVQSKTQLRFLLKYQKNNMFRPFMAITRFYQALKIVLYKSRD